MNSWHDSAIGRLFAIVLSVLALWAAMTLAGALAEWFQSTRHDVALRHDMKAVR